MTDRMSFSILLMSFFFVLWCGHATADEPPFPFSPGEGAELRRYHELGTETFLYKNKEGLDVNKLLKGECWLFRWPWSAGRDNDMQDLVERLGKAGARVLEQTKERVSWRSSPKAMLDTLYLQFKPSHDACYGFMMRERELRPGSGCELLLGPGGFQGIQRGHRTRRLAVPETLEVFIEEGSVSLEMYYKYKEGLLAQRVRYSHTCYRYHTDHHVVYDLP